MNVLTTLTLNGFREARRNRVTTVVFFFAFISIFSATFALELTVATYGRVMTDIGLGLMDFIAVFLAIFLCTALLPREVERRTIFMVLCRPISRSTFVVGRFLGNLLTVYFVTAIMAVLFVGQILLEGAPLAKPHAAAILGICMEVLVVSAVGFLFAAFSSQYIATIATVGLYFVGHLSDDLYRMATQTQSQVLHFLGRAAYYVFPNLHRLDFKARATYLDVTSWAEVGSAALYAIGYAMVLITLASLLFERRDLK